MQNIMKQMKTHGIEPIDLVVVNLYPFEKTVAKPDCTLDEAIENIDIGGPTMLRSSAKTIMMWPWVTDPQDYEKIIEEMKKSGGALSLENPFSFSQESFLN